MKDKLIIIGNGFDLWQGLNTSFSNFEKYYYAHRDAIMRRLLIRNYKIKDSAGHIKKISDVELIYGDVFDPGELDYDFWNAFETSLGEIDDERINLFFGKRKMELYRLAKSVKNAKKILTRAFVEWIRTIEIPKMEMHYTFDDTCTFLNFNYTKTLQIRFHVPDKDIHFIHGEATDKKSIIFGHSLQPDPPIEFAKRLGGRFRGLYYIETLLYETDKHAEENIALYILFLSLSGINSDDIKDVYALGHSFGKADHEYFRFLVDATRASSMWHISCFSDYDKQRVDEIMKELKFGNYSTYKSIDDCMTTFKI